MSVFEIIGFISTVLFYRILLKQNHVLHFIKIWLIEKELEGKWYVKPLGLCAICNSVWVTTALYSMLHFNLSLSFVAMLVMNVSIVGTIIAFVTEFNNNK